MALTNQQRAQKLADSIAAQVIRSANKGLKIAVTFLASRVKETLSVPAPRMLFTDPKTKEKSYIATTPATAGAPPRKLSGQLRRSITSEMIDDNKGVVGTNVVYAKQLEFGGTITPKQAGALRFMVPEAVPGKGKQKYTAKPVFVKSVTQAPHPFLMATVTKYKSELSKIIGQEVIGAYK